MAETGLRNRQPLHHGETVVTTAPSGGYTAGEFVAVGNLVGINVTDAAAGDLAAHIIKHPAIIVPCVAATTGDYGQGAPVYADAGNNRVASATASGLVFAGYVVEAPALGATEVLINFDSTLGTSD